MYHLIKLEESSVGRNNELRIFTHSVQLNVVSPSSSRKASKLQGILCCHTTR
jgi:hypothetical protein